MYNSVFDPSGHDESLDAKIVVGLERISEAFRVSLWQQSKQIGLSPIQIQLLLFLNFHDTEKCKVTYLAKEFNLTKATVSEAVRTILKKGLVVKEEDLSDTRSYSLRLTSDGKKIVEQTQFFANNILNAVQNLENQDKKALFQSLFNVIFQLQKIGVIQLQRMCFSCRYYKSGHGGKTHYCQYLQSSISENQLKIDCPDYESRN